MMRMEITGYIKIEKRSIPPRALMLGKPNPPPSLFEVSIEMTVKRGIHTNVKCAHDLNMRSRNRNVSSEKNNTSGAWKITRIDMT
jgi:hypothetical protein